MVSNLALFCLATYKIGQFFPNHLVTLSVTEKDSFITLTSALLMTPQPHGTLTAIMTTPTQQIPLTIPYPISVPQFQTGPPPTVVQPPPLAQLRPQMMMPAQPDQLSIRVRGRLAELNIPEAYFGDLIKLYSRTRDDFVSTMKKGYIAFFPFMLGAAWCQKHKTFFFLRRRHCGEIS
jgi:hypothetical protein